MTTPPVAPDLEQFLSYLKTSRGFDFTAYKRATLTRRIVKRMQEVRTDSYADYTDYLETHPAEFKKLFDSVLINVTGFFRDGPTWDYLAKEVVPQIIEGKGPMDPIRVWSGGCASGEEAYSIAMILADALGANEYRQRVKVYGTDLDEDALNAARRAVYSQKQLEAVRPDMRDRYFERSTDGYAFRPDLRRTVIFGRLDLLQDAPISRIDLLLCRNTLMYFNASAQSRVLTRLRFGLADRGYLVLGKAESLLMHVSGLTPVDLKLRIFKKTTRIQAGERDLPSLSRIAEQSVSPADNNLLREIAFEADIEPQIMVDADGALCAVNERARQMFGLRTADIGRPLQDLEISYRPLELRSPIERSYTERRALVLGEVEWSPNGEGLKRWFNVTVTPLWQGDDATGVKVAFADVTRFRTLQKDLESAQGALKGALEELQSTVEELETTNEELQSTVEELETTNEELQSTNEELETMNEELQSTNDELESVNMEMRERGDELNRSNAFLEKVLTSLRVGVIALEPNLHVDVWNRVSEETWGLRRDEVRGKPFTSLDFGLPVTDVMEQVETCLAGGQPERMTILSVNRLGRRIRCEVHCMPYLDADVVAGVILLIEATENEA